jgi:uncharacterized membrane protein
MMGLLQFQKTTVLGGIKILVPIVVLVLIIAKAFEIMKKVAEPLSAFFPADMTGVILIVNLLAFVLIILISFFAGLAAKSATAGKVIQGVETSILSRIPLYPVIKGLTASIASVEENEDMKPVLARLDDYSQIAFEIERLDGGDVAVFLPGAPNPGSGTVCIMAEDRVQSIDTTMIAAMQSVRRFGVGTAAVLRGNPQAE